MTVTVVCQQLLLLAHRNGRMCLDGSLTVGGCSVVQPSAHVSGAVWKLGFHQGVTFVVHAAAAAGTVAVLQTLRRLLPRLTATQGLTCGT